MKIGVNARFLESPHIGIGQYTLNLFKTLANENPKDDFILVTRKKIKGEFPKNIHIKVIAEKKWLLLSSLKKGFWEHFQLRKYFNKQDFDLIHFTYPAYPICGIKKRSTTTIHDIIPWQDKRYRKKLRSKIYFWLTGKALKKAPAFIAVSETTKKDFASHFGIDPGKVVVTYEAASPAYLENPTGITTVYGLRSNSYLLYVGGYDKRKNVDKLIDLWKKLDDPNLTLVLVGGQLYKDKLYSSYTLPNSDKKNKLNILKTGFISEKELSTLYRKAVAVINISGQEGFNIPLLEAAYSETPIITSDIPVHREIYGEDALLLSPGKELSALKKFLGDPALQDKYRNATKALREKYTWDKTAQKTYEIYQLTCAKHNIPTSYHLPPTT